jgi:hypothetical protein
MLKHAEILERRKTAKAKADPVQTTDWGWRRDLATAGDYVVFVETLLAGANQGVRRATHGQQTLYVLAGVLWFKDRASGAVTRLAARQSVTTNLDSEYEIATSREGAEILVVQSAGFEAALERVAGTGNRLHPKPGARRPPTGPTPRRRPQVSFEDRTASANGAQGLGRTQPLPAQPRAAADVSFSFGPTGVNLAPVLPEP